MQAERRMAWRTSACLPKDQPRSFMRLLEQGQESQSASVICSGGVSTVIGSSDLDAHSFVPSGHKVISIKAHCLIDGSYGNVGVACLLPALAPRHQCWRQLVPSSPRTLIGIAPKNLCVTTSDHLLLNIGRPKEELCNSAAVAVFCDASNAN